MEIILIEERQIFGESLKLFSVRSNFARSFKIHLKDGYDEVSIFFD